MKHWLYYLGLLSRSSDMVLMTNKRYIPNYITWAYWNMELSFFKAHKETHLNLEPIDDDCAFVIIDQENQLDEIKNDDERCLYLEESRSQETWNNGN